MTDLAHDFGADLQWGATGDLALAAGPDAGRQRVLRRLLTNRGDYLWDLGYGAGLAGFVGEPAAVPRVRAVIRGQIFREAAVARTPEPVIETEPAGPSALSLRIRYADAAGEAVAVALTLTAGGV